MIELFSDIHEDLSSILQLRDTTIHSNRNRIDRYKMVHSFVNMQDITLEDEDGNEETYINFGSFLRSALLNVLPLENMVTGNDSLVSVALDFNEPNHDPLISIELSNLLNKWIFRTPEMYNFWRSFVGESYLLGGGAIIWEKENEGLYPEVRHEVIFPKNTPTITDKISYAFEKREIYFNDLKKILNTTRNDDKNVNKEDIEEYIEQFKKKIRNNDSKGRGEYSDISVNSARDEDGVFGEDDNITVEVWHYFEVRRDKKGTYVSLIVFANEFNHSSKEASGCGAVILDQKERHFRDVDEWLIFGIMDEEIGGSKTVDTIRGISETHYKASVKIEELNNRQMEGALASSTPYLQDIGNADPTEVESFRMGDTFIPKDVAFAQIPNVQSQLSPIVQNLANTVSGIASTGQSNTGRGQELRQQAIERQDNSSILKSNKLNKAIFILRQVCRLITYRSLTLEPTGQHDDYKKIRGFQKSFDRKIIETYKLIDDEGVSDGIDEGSKTALAKAKIFRKKIAEISYGEFDYLDVDINKTVTGLDRPNEEAIGRAIMEAVNMGIAPEQNRSFLVQQAMVYLTQNPDVAKLVGSPPERIQSEQYERASSEWASILNRANIGEIYPVGSTDVHSDHIESHKKDLIGLINRHKFEPWTELTVAQFTAAVNHIGLHIKQLQQRPESKESSRMIMKELQEIIGQASAIIQEVQKQKEDSQESEPNPDDVLKMAKVQKIMHDMEIDGRKLGIDLQKEEAIQSDRGKRDQRIQEKQNSDERSKLVKEVKDHRELELKEKQINGKFKD